MAKLDPFSAQIVNLVRQMPDEALLQLVRQQLLAATTDGGAAPEAVVAPAVTAANAAAAAPTGRKKAAKRTAARTTGRAAAPAAAPQKKAPARQAGGRATSADKLRDLATIERVIKASRGMSASEIARATNIPQERAASLVRELKHERRIFQGGDRRFARYAGDAKTAQLAAEMARKSARGPRG